MTVPNEIMRCRIIVTAVNLNCFSLMPCENETKRETVDYSYVPSIMNQ